jgi:AcrR family transcriptional regulator
MKKQRPNPLPSDLLDACVAAYVRAGTIELSLDGVAEGVGISKRMLVHYFGSRENLEELAMERLEERLRARFAPEAFPAAASARRVVSALWEQTTAPDSAGILRLLMDLSRRAWNGSPRARAFYREQWRLWEQLLARYIRDERTVEDLLQLFQGAALAFLVTGDPEPGRRALKRMLSRTGQ